MHCCAIVTEIPPSVAAMEMESRKPIFNLWIQTDSYIILNRPGLYSNHNESSLERVCRLLAADQVFTECC